MQPLGTTQSQNKIPRLDHQIETGISFSFSNNKVYTPKNYNDVYPNREITLLEAIGTSDNIYAVKLGLHLGSENFKKAIDFSHTHIL